MRMILTFLLFGGVAMAEPVVIEDFGPGAETRWRYVSDRVMGGVSDGQGALGSEAGTGFAQLRGTVSTANNGGFIQIRHDLSQPVATDATGLQVRVRGNGAPYFVHIRTTASRRPWQFYQARFVATADWTIIDLPWSAFVPNGGQRGTLTAADITNIGLVAYGADYQAELDVDYVAALVAP